MSAVVVATAFGGPEVLSVIDEPVGAPGPGQVRIAVRAAGVNPIDYKVYGASHGADPSLLSMRLGLEVAGVVSAVGSGASGPAGPIAVGDEVIAYRVAGGYAAELIAGADAVLPKPAAMSFEQAGGLLLAGATAAHVIAAIDVRAGDTVLLSGASGGVGLIAIQLATARGASVIATASPAHHDLLRDYGARPVAYGSGLTDRLRALAPDGIDAAGDLVGTDEALDASLDLVSDRARIATIANGARAARDGILLLGGAPGADRGDDVRNAARRQLTDAFTAGRLRVRVAGTYPLAEVAAAHREIRAGHTAGKLVLIP